MSDYTFIVNPKAGRGASLRSVEPLKRELRVHRLDYDLFFTQKAGDATRIARETASQIVVAVGGDGTVNEVANGLIGTGKILGVIPAGSGNDLTKSIGVPTNLIQAVENLSRRRVRSVDIGTVTCSTTGPNDHPHGNLPLRYFVNGVGVGFDAAVAEMTRQIKYISGTLLYLVAVFRTLGSYVAPRFDVSVDGLFQSKKRLLIAVGNGRCAGGGFYLTPNARVDDGKLDICLIDDISVPKILQLMPRVMRGKHLGFKGVTFQVGKKISISSDQTFFVHADGEMVGRKVNRVEIGLLEKAMNVVVGDSVS